MAKKTFTTYIKELAGANPAAASRRDAPDFNISQTTSVSTTEKDKFLARLGEPAKTKVQQANVSGTSLDQYIQPLAKKIAKNKHDHQMIMELAPEVGQAATIVVPSIISPCDLSDRNLQYFLDTSRISDAQKTKIAELIDQHFNGTLKISERLPEVIERTLYTSGSTPFMIVPASELDVLANDENVVIPATEAYGKFQACLKESLFGLADDNASDYKPAGECIAAIESVLSEHLPQVEKPSGRGDASKAESYNLQERTTALQALAKKVLATESFGIVDNPDELKREKLTKDKKKKSIKDAIGKKYKPTPFHAMKADPSAEQAGQPMLIELPPESVTPIFKPGNPKDHLGYFVAIDEAGLPITIKGADTVENPRPLPNTNRMTVPELYKAFGYEMPTAAHNQDKLMSDLYGRIMDSYLKNRLESKGFGAVNMGTDSSMYECMFARFLEARKTRLLFVPKELMVYFCYRYNEDGTGRSKLEDIRFILSLRISLLICRYLSAFNDAIQRRKLEVTFGEDTPIGDPEQFLRELEQKAIEKSMVSVSWQPQDTMRQLATKGISVSAKGYPGAENFEITNEGVETRTSTPDDGLMEDIRKMLIIWLDVPPSAYNSLDEAEFARSVATMNLFFSRKISLWQKITCNHMSELAQIYVSFSKPLIDKIKEILAMKDDSTSKNDGTGTDDAGEEDLLAEVLSSIRATLPSPNIAPDKTQFEELETFINSINAVCEAVYSDDLLGNDRDLAESLTSIRASVKSKIVREHLNQIGLLNRVDVPTVDTVNLPEIMALHRMVLNTAKGMKDQKEKMTPPPGGDDAGGGGAPPFG